MRWGGWVHFQSKNVCCNFFALETAILVKSFRKKNFERGGDGDGDDDVHPHHDYKAQVFADQQLLTESRQMIGNWSCSQQSVLTA